MLAISKRMVEAFLFVVENGSGWQKDVEAMMFWFQSPISPRYLSVTVKQGTVKPAYNDLYLDRNLLRKTMK